MTRKEILIAEKKKRLRTKRKLEIASSLSILIASLTSIFITTLRLSKMTIKSIISGENKTDSLLSTTVYLMFFVIKTPLVFIQVNTQSPTIIDIIKSILSDFISFIFWILFLLLLYIKT
eukprot:GHVP01068447.1.p1 GENE.GHVP01068447.1~~GHVP01068447.1.p1  ORF type:complete len:119 (-),score=12.46 GHVP01068447.1:205-561(-)